MDRALPPKAFESFVPQGTRFEGELSEQIRDLPCQRKCFQGEELHGKCSRMDGRAANPPRQKRCGVEVGLDNHRLLSDCSTFCPSPPTFLKTTRNRVGNSLTEFQSNSTQPPRNLPWGGKEPDGDDDTFRLAQNPQKHLSPGQGSSSAAVRVFGTKLLGMWGIRSADSMES